MNHPTNDKGFTGAIPKLYESYLVPMIFAPYADDLARRLASRRVSRVLEIAAGTGVVTRAMDAALPAHTSIVATDLNQAMLDQAAATGVERPVTWRQADAMALPFEDQAFDAVVCQFGAMFFPDRVKAFAEVRRVLAPDGGFIFSVWDRIEENELADVISAAVAARYPHDPPRFLERTPYGYYDRRLIERDLTTAAFSIADFATVTARSRAASPRLPAVAFCEGTPLRNEIEARDPSGLEAATSAATERIAERFGTDAVDAKMQAHVIAAHR